MQIVPALYVKEGRLAAYKPGDFEHIEYLDADPYELIALLDKLNIGHLALIDIDAERGAHSNASLLGSLANITIATLHVGGGIHDMDYLKSLQYAGVDYFILGSVVFENPAFLQAISEAEDVKNDRITISIDLLDGEVTYHAWSREADVTLDELIRRCIAMGFSRFILHDVSKDSNRGPRLELFRQVAGTFPDCRFVAAGQVNSFSDIEELEKTGVVAVVVGNEIYKNPVLLQRISDYNHTHQDEDA